MWCPMCKCDKWLLVSIIIMYDLICNELMSACLDP